MADVRITPSEWPEALAETDGAQLIVGGPGTGKTEFLVRRAVHLVGEGVPLDRILLLSFSRRGAADLRSRLEHALDRSHAGVRASTFHALAHTILEAEIGTKLAWPRMPTLLTALDQVLVVRRLLADSDPQLWSPAFRHMLTTDTLAQELADFLLRSSELLLGPADIAAAERDDWKGIPEFMDTYRHHLIASGRIDYGTLQAHAVELLSTDDVAGRLAAENQYVLVDEYQDTTRAQARLLLTMREAGSHLTVAGDPYQSIYSFRGADLANIADFPSLFADQEGNNAARRILTQSFRVPAAILEAAVRVTSQAELPGAAGEVTPVEAAGSVEARVFDQLSAETEFIAREVQRLHLEESVPYHRIAVFVRSKRRLLSELSRALEQRAIPHRIPDNRLVDHPAVQFVIDCVTAAVEPAADQAPAVKRILLGSLFAQPIGLVRDLLAMREAHGTPWPDLLEQHVPGSNGLGGLLRTVEWASAVPADEGLWHLWQNLPRFGQIVSDPDRAEDRAAWRSLSQVLSRLHERDATATLADWVRWSREESFEAQPLLDYRPQGVDQLTLTTLHQSKGLEADVVFIADAVEGVFPDLRARESILGSRHLSPSLPSDAAGYKLFRLQEESRIAYTAMTRARRRVLWTATTNGGELGDGTPSRFMSLASGLSLSAMVQPITEPDPITPLEAESWLRRRLADPAQPDAVRLAALAALAGGPAHGLRPAGEFAGVSLPGPDSGLAPDDPTMSPTRAELYETCPRRYALEHRLGIRDDTSVYMHFGSIVHTVLERAEAEAILAGHRHSTLGRAREILSELWVDTDFGGGEWNTAWRRRAERALAWTYEKWPRPAAAGLETERQVEFDHEGVPWRGRIDRLETEGETVRVVDYKTGASQLTKAEAASSLQLGVYLLAASSDPDLTRAGEVTESEIWYVAQPPNRDSLKTRSFDGENLDGIRQRMTAVAAGIAADLWPATPNERCDRCRVKLVCPAFPEGRRAYLR